MVALLALILIKSAHAAQEKVRHYASASRSLLSERFLIRKNRTPKPLAPSILTLFDGQDELDIDYIMSFIKAPKEDIYWELDLLELNGTIKRRQVGEGKISTPVWSKNDATKNI